MANEIELGRGQNVTFAYNNVTIASFSNETYDSITNGSISMGIKGCSPTVKIILDWITLISLPVLMLTMGCEIEIHKLWAHLKRPYGPAIGMLSQFIVLPLCMFGVAHALQLDNFSALALMITAATPGGGLSNLFTYWVDGDVPLSLTMTVLSNTLGLGMMPLNVWIYCRSWTNDTLHVPYKNIVISLAVSFVSAAIGIFIRWKWEKKGQSLVKIGSKFGILVVTALFVLLNICHSYVYKSPLKVFAGAVSLTPVGLLFGYIVSKLFRMSNAHARTVALETGIQNFSLCFVVITWSFSPAVVSKMIFIPVLAGFNILGSSSLFVFGYIFVKKLKGSEKHKKEEHTSKAVDSDAETGVRKELLAKDYVKN